MVDSDHRGSLNERAVFNVSSGVFHIAQVSDWCLAGEFDFAAFGKWVEMKFNPLRAIALKKCVVMSVQGGSARAGIDLGLDAGDT